MTAPSTCRTDHLDIAIAETIVSILPTTGKIVLVVADNKSCHIGRVDCSLVAILAGSSKPSSLCGWGRFDDSGGLDFKGSRLVALDHLEGPRVS